MEYNYYYEVVSIIRLGILIFDTGRKKQLYRLGGKLFLAAPVSQIVLSAIDLISCLMVENAHMVFRGVNQLFCVLYVVMQIDPHPV